MEIIISQNVIPYSLEDIYKRVKENFHPVFNVDAGGAMKNEPILSFAMPIVIYQTLRRKVQEARLST
jgi:hypothetical protein